MGYCSFCKEYYGFHDFCCMNEKCKDIRKFIDKYGIDALHKILVIFHNRKFNLSTNHN